MGSGSSNFKPEFSKSDQYIQGVTQNPWAQQARQQQQDFGSQLQAAAMGQVPSAAELQMKQGLEQGQNQALGLALSQRGLSPAQSARMAQMSSSQQAIQMNPQMAAMRAQEQAQARGMYGNYLGQARGQDIQSLLGQAGMMSQEDLAKNQMLFQQALQNAQNQFSFKDLMGGAMGAGGAFLGGL